MATSNNAHYIDDTSVDPELVCNICYEHFKDPYCTPCDHTFCRQCITERIRSGSAICPRCAKPLSILGIHQASRTVRDILTRIRVVCRHCGQTGLQRENFNDHLNKGCPKTQMVCSAVDVRCPWTGTRDQLDQHLKTCAYNSLHSILSRLLTENRQLQEEVKKLKQHSEEKYAQHNKDIDTTTNYIHTSIQQMNEQLDVDENRIEKHDIEIEYLKNQISQLEIRIRKLQEENQLKKIDTLRLSQQCNQHEIQIKQLTKKLNLIIESIDYHNATLIDRIEKCDQRLMGLNQKNLNDQDMLIVVQRAIIKKQCKELNLQCNEITWQGASILADALTNDTNMEIIYLHNNHISDLGAQYLSQSLSTKNFTLKTLDLGSNDITDQGAEYLSDMLKTNQTLVHLYLRNNQISDRGVQALANTLAYPNKTLEELVVDQNKMISDSCIELLVNMLIQNRSLKTLRIWECNLSEVGTATLRDVVKHKHGFTLSD